MGVADWIGLGQMDELGRMDTPMHRIDARAKACVTVAFIVVVMSFPRYEISALVPFLFYPLVLVSLGRIPGRHIVRKIWVASPFALAVGLFNPFFDRQPYGPLGVAGGWVSFASVLLRFLLTVGAALALVACTGMNRLAAGLGRMGVPRVFVVQLLFLYRYLFVVSDEGGKMLRSVEMRSEKGRPLRFRPYGSLLGTLLLRSMDRAERVYRAMVARGFDGEVRELGRPAIRFEDILFVGVWLAFFIIARVWNLADGLGLLLTGIWA
ncbi:MAG TPA: cobalt ECF transporter T component CbiQ [Kiritimatiellia bacterium]|nr:cobalt ECF transporter T component CbiQ [Kiritimatiellia bacterium]HRU69633.1 cobalt ECF transporter T component CbiQ [Kiritimatiellia bacterium]